MSGAKRKIRRAQEKRIKKEVDQRMREIQEQMNSVPITCNTCDEEFNKHDKSMIATWKIDVRSESMFLTCPSCDKKSAHEQDKVF